MSGVSGLGNSNMLDQMKRLNELQEVQKAGFENI